MLFMVRSRVIQAQSITHSVLGTAGIEATSGSHSLSWTTGEVVIETVTNQNYTVTQGFHQTRLGPVNTGIEDTRIPVIANAYPNPFGENFFIEFDQNVKVDIRMMDIVGKLIYSEKFSGKLYERSTWNMPAGVYFVQLVFDDGNTSLFKLVRR